MAIVFAILGFVTGVSVGSGAVLFTLAGRRDTIYRSLVKRRPIIKLFAGLSLITSAIACGIMFAYLGYMLAE